MLLPGPCGCRQSAPGTYSHQARLSRRSTGPRGFRNTEEPGTTSEGERGGGVGSRVHGGIGRPLAGRDVARRTDEFLKVGVGHGIGVDPESLHCFPTYGPLFAIEVV